ncbi:MAG: alpha/beta hydrolase family protein, partial [Fuerstiella sp.]|nr:alpha/beta hydrolase family protein [Fuerstiella sp.]
MNRNNPREPQRRCLALALSVIAAWAPGLIIPASGQELNIEAEKIVRSGRPDGRHVSTRGFVQHLVRNARPRLAFNPHFTPEEFQAWQTQVRARMRELLSFPETPQQPAPRRLWAKEREGYRLEKWELYPEPGSVVP